MNDRQLTPKQSTPMAEGTRRSRERVEQWTVDGGGRLL